MKKSFLLLLLPMLAFAQTPNEKPSEASSRFKIYILSEFDLEAFRSDAAKPIVITPTHATKGQVVILLDTQTGRTWYLSTSVVSPDAKSAQQALAVQYFWEPIHFGKSLFPDIPTSPPTR
jgi:hypothetical protein